jgi:hypothetical protein
VERDATLYGWRCPQYPENLANGTPEYVGDEDCLNLKRVGAGGPAGVGAGSGRALLRQPAIDRVEQACSHLSAVGGVTARLGRELERPRVVADCTRGASASEGELGSEEVGKVVFGEDRAGAVEERVGRRQVAQPQLGVRRDGQRGDQVGVEGAEGAPPWPRGSRIT